ncbi:unnamed protein product [Symbiodinium sp. CCMP2592]|nr:unnamed protein product [Symbiodinium sp. CCMP2592]
MSNKFVNTASRVVWFLRLGAFLTLADAIYLPLAENFGNKLGLSPGVFLTLDNSMVLATLDTLDQGKLLEELEHMGRTQGKRIAFPGRVNYDSQHCIVSFPGKYSEEWDAAVRMVEVRSSACSLACVFLTDPDSGLGVHEDNPEEPGNCWCKALYGQVPAATYITIVEDPMALSAEDLRFKESDAAAMGQIFLKREGQSDEQWAEAKEAAQTAARAKCEENRGRAPWGCRWFHDWKRNVDEAVARGQTLHVFYFEGRVGCGKLPWQELSNETSVKKARENGGLGASQTAEVAYLERCGCAFQEHDVKVFYRFMEEHKTNI